MLSELRSALAAVCALGGLALASPSQASDMLWGVNGHPFASYPGVTYEQQADTLKALGAKSYRVDIYRIESMENVARLIDVMKSRGIEVLPLLIPPVDLEKQSVEDLRQKSFAFAEAYVRRFPQIKVWELGNELENYALIKPCEMRDDGTKYPCEWGIAGGVGALDYYGPRYVKVAAVLRGLSEGAHAANPQAKRAIGSAGWGHVGIFERLKNDGVDWDISVWHWYADSPEWAFKKLAEYGKPIWVTEFNHSKGSETDGEEGQARGLTEMTALLKRLAPTYNVQAAHLYELLDETYWQPNFEGYMGVVHLDRTPDGKGWQLGSRKPAFDAYRNAITAP